MNIADLLTTERIACCPEAGSKKRSLETISSLLAAIAPDITQEEIFTSLLNRERLGSTGLGKGVAIPHGRLAGLNEPAGAFIKLKEAVDFDAIDGQPVDLIFALLVPEEANEEHLTLLAQLARMFSDNDFCARLRSADNAASLAHLLQDWEHRKSA